MTEVEKELISDFSDDLFTQEEFLTRYPVTICDLKRYVFTLLVASFVDKRRDDVIYGLLLGFCLKECPFDYSFLDVMHRLLEADWHYSHEDIVSIVRDINHPLSIEVLYNTALNKIEFLPSDFFFGLPRKCIKAISAIGGDDAIRCLRLLSQHDVAEIRGFAIKELKYKGLNI